MTRSAVFSLVYPCENDGSSRNEVKILVECMNRVKVIGNEKLNGGYVHLMI